MATTQVIAASTEEMPFGAVQAVAQVEIDKRAVYRHPLFPLLALLFEKCELATQSADYSMSDSFDVDIQAFVQHQERDKRPFFSDDQEVDGLMVKAIQVLRIHLLELEKVQELCKDFCNRYIACLKNKMQSENLLRSDYPSYNSSSSSDTDSHNSSSEHSLTSSSRATLQQHVQVLNQVNNVLVQPAVQPTLSLQSGQIMSGGTVYQMLQTTRGILAQPIQTTVTATQLISGNTPISQIGTGPTLKSESDRLILTAESSMTNSQDEDEDIGSRKKQKRGVLPKNATGVMRTWLFQHIVHPYPTEDEKRQIANQTNLTLLQVNNWFINARRRILQPMLDASNPELSHKPKKPKTQSSRPIQRFWPENIASLQPTHNQERFKPNMVDQSTSCKSDTEVGSSTDPMETRNGILIDSEDEDDEDSDDEDDDIEDDGSLCANYESSSKSRLNIDCSSDSSTMDNL